MFVCDKCKKKLKEVHAEPDDKDLQFRMAGNTIRANGNYYDLCDDCYADLKELRDKTVAEFFGEGDEDGTL